MSRLSIYSLAGAAALLFAASIGRADTMNPIGINVAADSNSTPGSMTGEQPETEADDNAGTPPQPGTAGVVPILNWNNLIITRFKTNAQIGGQNVSSSNLPLAQGVSSGAMPFALNDDTGTASGASVTAWTGGDSFSVYGSTKTNNDAQLMNGFLGAQNNPTGTGVIPASITVAMPSGDVSAGYSVYVYFNSGGAGQNCNISLTTSGGFASPIYYELSEGTSQTGIPFDNTVGEIGPNKEGIYTYTDGSANNSTTNLVGYTAATAANYVVINVPAGSGSSFTASLAEPTSSNPGITAIEIVPVPEPTSLALLLIAAPAAWVISRRRKVAA